MTEIVYGSAVCFVVFVMVKLITSSKDGSSEFSAIVAYIFGYSTYVLLGGQLIGKSGEYVFQPVLFAAMSFGLYLATYVKAQENKPKKF